MSAFSFLSELREKGIVITLNPDGEHLQVNAPKGAIDETLRAELGRRKGEILTFLHEIESGATTLIERRSPDAPLELSAAQERVWHLHRLAPGTADLNIVVPWEIRGPIDVNQLCQAVEGLMERHESLRCRFDDFDGMASIRLDADAVLPLEVIDFTTVGTTDLFDKALTEATSFGEQPFDLATSTARAGLFAMADDHHLLVLAFHQIIFDWGSADSIASDLSALYADAGSEVMTSGSAPGLTYLDYASWQNSWLEGPDRQRQAEFWRDQLSEPYSALRLPVSPRTLGDDSVKRSSFHLSADVVEGLGTLARGAGATLYMALIGAWQALLAGYSEAEDSMCFTMLGLNKSELKGVVGLVANPVPIRLDLSGDPSPTELLDRVRSVALGAYGHQDLPLTDVMEFFTSDRSSQSARPFQSLFLFQHEPTTPLVVGDANTKLLTLGRHAPAFDLRMFTEETPEGVSGWLETSGGVVASEAAKLVEAYERLLGAMVEEPTAPLSSLMPIADEEKIAEVQQSGPATITETPPSTENEKLLHAVWSEMFGRSVSIDEDFFALGGHSLMAISMFLKVEEQTGVSLPLAALFEATTIRQLATLLEEDWEPDWTSLVPIKPTGSRTPIFCVAALGDEIIQFGELAGLLNNEQPFYALQQGVDRSDEIRTTIPDIAAHYLDEIRSVQPTGPYCIAGYCFGGLVAFEMAHQLRQQGDSVSQLLLVDSDAPGGIHPVAVNSADRLQRALPMIRTHGIGGVAGWAIKRVSKLWRWTIWTRLRHYLHRGFDWVGLDLPDQLKDILQINAQAADEYERVMKPYEGDAILLRAEIVPEGMVYEDDLGWTDLIKGSLQIQSLPGDHETIWKSPNVQQFAALVDQVASSGQ